MIFSPGIINPIILPSIQVYERNPKAPAQRAGKVMRSSSKTTWDRKMRDKAERQHFLGIKKEAIDELKGKKKVSEVKAQELGNVEGETLL